MKTKRLAISHWHKVFPEVLHAIRYLLCTSTNTTTHERMFNFQHCSAIGATFLSWLSQTGPVLLGRHGRSSKHDPLTDEVELIGLHATSSYAQVRFQTGREATVSL